jgi:PAS domain S-box-containing protein
MITTPNRAEESLKKEKEKFEALFQHASLGILAIDSSGNISMANGFLLSLFGYQSEKELIGKKIEMLIPSRYHSRHTHHRDQYNENPHPRPMGVGKDLFAVKKDGSEFPVEISLSNYTTDEGSFAIAFVSDITKRKEIETAVILQKEQLAAINDKIEELNNDLEQKVELRTKQLQETMAQLQVSKDELTNALSKEKELSDLKSRFVSMASHEFRTPLSTILSSASLVAKYTESVEQEKRDKHINRIKSSVNNLTDILNEFLSLGKIEDGKIIAHFVDFNIRENMEAVCNEMQTHTKSGQQINYTHMGREMINLDPSMLRNIIINLLSNAIKFSPEKGIITVQTGVKDNTIRITVQDNGIGISEEEQEHLFERFFRASNATNIQGTGLGLHIVGKYVELMDGHIDFKSTLEQGTEINITFNTSL